jgi:hypothetical protein
MRVIRLGRREVTVAKLDHALLGNLWKTFTKLVSMTIQLVFDVKLHNLRRSN